MRSRNAVRLAARVLGYDEVVIANLCAVATPSVVQLNCLGSEAWESSRVDLELAVRGGAGLLAAWGIGGLSGHARSSLRTQVNWLVERAESGGLRNISMVGGEPRHPSRWHQYVSDKHGRTRGGTFEERLAQVIVDVPIHHLRARRL